MKIGLTVTYRDGTSETYTTRLMDLVKWERLRGKPISVLSQNIGVEDLATMAYVCADPSNTGFDAWMETVDTVDLASGEPGNPTNAAA